ncbi:MAG: polyprenyl synthetase family protein [Pyrinomonadaceae bacterium]|nr:polyprenyl synthetase family protein [Pyrinomonadaceae bacterium]
MSLIEIEFEQQASSNVQVIDYLGDYLRVSGGKRLRPALCVLSHHCISGGKVSESLIKMATVMEMLHTATLVHDDIIDNAEKRRNRPSVNARFGNQTAVLMGDWLYMKAFEVSLKERNLEILDILTNVTRKMTEGELIQLTTIGRIDISEEEYFDILRRKTAYLFSACCEIGAILAGADDSAKVALREYGMNLGIAFQLTDDLLDFSSSDEVLGKSAGADLIEGKVTLPLILLLEKKPEFAEKLKIIMYDGNYDRISREEILRELEESGAIEKARKQANDFAEKAKKNLELLLNSEYRSTLEAICLYMVKRIK